MGSCLAITHLLWRISGNLTSVHWSECCNSIYAADVFTPSKEDFCNGPGLQGLASDQVLGGWLEMMCSCQPCFCFHVLDVLSNALPRPY